MVELDQYKTMLGNTEEPYEELRDSLNPAGLKSKIEELEQTMADPAFWNDPDNAGRVTQRMTALKKKISDIEELENYHEEIELLLEMGYEEEDESLIPELRSTYKKYEKKLEKMRIATLLSGEYDRNNAILTLHAGAGGTESCDWVSMLYRMYSHYAENQGFKCEVLDFLDGDEAGIKTITLEITGENAYGLLKSEKGIHRLVRISPFNSAGKRQTSFASCDVMPEIDDNIELEINEEDLRIDTYRSSGAGGQHINKTSSAIRITHIPTGIVVQCQNERSQLMNKEKAMNMLRSKLYLLKKEEQAEKISDIRGEVREINFGSQIRSYVMHPYSLVKDHRTNEETGNVQAVMDGDLNPFINAYLRKCVALNGEL